MKAQYLRELEQRASAELIAAEDVKLNVDLYVPLAFMLLGTIQLALRHPDVPPTPREHMTLFARGLHELLAKHGTGIGEICEMGWNSMFDPPTSSSSLSGQQGANDA